LVTAAHCVVDETVYAFFGHRSSLLPDGSLAVSCGNPGERRTLVPVNVVSAGDWHKGWDVAVLSAETGLHLTVIPLGDDTKLAPGDRVVSVSSPLAGDIKFWFEGYVSAMPSQVEPKTLADEPVLRNTVFLQLPGMMGSSGAA